MSTRKETERAKLMQEKCQTLLTQMLRDEDNKYCVDCDAKGPRWASWNLGVFLCIRCAGIHRNLGVHISRVKSVNLDTWTPEQVVSLQQMGNSRARAVYEAQLPDGFRRPQTDSALESFIRAKYEHKKYLAREWVPPPPPKVDWAKEIDEEIEKQKRKKKSTQTNSSLGILGPVGDKKSSNTVPTKTPLPAPLPKPKSSNSPKTNRTNVSATAISATNQDGLNQQSSDLLGLSTPTNPTGPSGSISKAVNNDLQGDSFSSFLSAPVSNSGILNGTSITATNLNIGTSGVGEKKDLTTNSLAKEEADFFNQTTLNTASSSGNDKEKGKLTKDNILALYGTAPTNTGSLGQFNNNPLGGFNSTFNPQPTGTGQFMSMGLPTGQTQTFPSLIPGGISNATGVPVSNAGSLQFGGGLAGNLNLNLAGMPQGFMGPPQHHAPTQFMTPPTSTTMYSAPVMTAPGAFTSAIPQQQPSFAQFTQQGFGTIPTAFGSPLSAAGAPTVATASAAQSSAASANLSQQFGNLNLGNVWQ